MTQVHAVERDGFWMRKRPWERVGLQVQWHRSPVERLEQSLGGRWERPLRFFYEDALHTYHVTNWVTHGALPHRAPCTRRTADPVHHVWRR